jgi:hypothetical protein
VVQVWNLNKLANWLRWFQHWKRVSWWCSKWILGRKDKGCGLQIDRERPEVSEVHTCQLM